MPTGQTAIIVPIPEAEALVGPWRARFDKHAAQGVPAHITLISPFVAPDALDQALPRAWELLAGEPPDFSLRFQAWPGLAVLVPEPEAWFRERSEALCRAFGLLPYGGKHGAEVRPHLTVAYGDPDPQVEADRFAAIAADLGPRLPLRARAHELRLLQACDTGWQVRATLPLGPLL